MFSDTQSFSVHPSEQQLIDTIEARMPTLLRLFIICQFTLKQPLITAFLDHSSFRLSELFAVAAERSVIMNVNISHGLVTRHSLRAELMVGLYGRRLAVAFVGTCMHYSNSNRYITCNYRYVSTIHT